MKTAEYKKVEKVWKEIQIQGGMKTEFKYEEKKHGQKCMEQKQDWRFKIRNRNTTEMEVWDQSNRSQITCIQDGVGGDTAV